MPLKILLDCYWERNFKLYEDDASLGEILLRISARNPHMFQ
jgi:hypothetical protein